MTLLPDQALQLLGEYLTSELGETNVRLEQRANETRILVQKMAGAKSIMGSFIVRRDDSLSQDGHCLVVMKRSKVSRVENQAPGLKCRDRSYIGERSGGL